MQADAARLPGALKPVREHLKAGPVPAGPADARDDAEQKRAPEPLRDQGKAQCDSAVSPAARM